MTLSDEEAEALWRMQIPSILAPGPCALCDREPALGYASVTEGDVERWYCHEGEDSCYEQAMLDIARSSNTRIIRLNMGEQA